MYVLRVLVGILFFIFFICSCSHPEETIIYLVRHAEKDLTDTTDNPPLTVEGEERAAQLVKMMEGVELEGIFSTSYDRNICTVKPIANERSLEIERYEWYEWEPMLEEIKKNAGKNFLICGHGDNLLPMIEYLGGEKPLERLEKHEYDKLFKVRYSHEHTSVEMLTY